MRGRKTRASFHAAPSDRAQHQAKHSRSACGRSNVVGDLKIVGNLKIWTASLLRDIVFAAFSEPGLGCLLWCAPLGSPSDAERPFESYPARQYARCLRRWDVAPGPRLRRVWVAGASGSIVKRRARARAGEPAIEAGRARGAHSSVVRGRLTNKAWLGSWWSLALHPGSSASYKE